MRSASTAVTDCDMGYRTLFCIQRRWLWHIRNGRRLTGGKDQADYVGKGRQQNHITADGALSLLMGLAVPSSIYVLWLVTLRAARPAMRVVEPGFFRFA